MCDDDVCYDEWSRRQWGGDGGWYDPSVCQGREGERCQHMFLIYSCWPILSVDMILVLAWDEDIVLWPPESHWP